MKRLAIAATVFLTGCATTLYAPGTVNGAPAQFSVNIVEGGFYAAWQGSGLDCRTSDYKRPFHHGPKFKRDVKISCVDGRTGTGVVQNTDSFNAVVLAQLTDGTKLRGDYGIDSTRK